MISRLFPDHYYDSIYQIQLEDLKNDGVSGLILDLDNTIIARNLSVASDDLIQWVNSVKAAGFKACILSNNWKQRVSTIAAQLDLPLVARAAKPRKGAFKRAMKVLGTSEPETVVIGDQIFTDVFGGNKLGLKTILVMPLSAHEALHTRFLRLLERSIMRRWQKHSHERLTA